MDVRTFAVFGDGACQGNPGPGGWGAIVVHPDGRREELSGGEVRTTNNRMELIAVLEGLSVVPSGGAVAVTTDSQYVVQGASSWLRGWKRKGWRTASGGPVLNQDLWESIDAELERLRIAWAWIRGHNGHPENERCDFLARQAASAAAASRPGRASFG